MLNDGVELMVLGMGIVFLFLVMLIVAVNMMTFIVQKYFPSAEVKQKPVPANAGNEAGRVAAISAAVHQHRKK